jgi:D-alanyl-D-alanine carboxypeptidase
VITSATTIEPRSGLALGALLFAVSLACHATTGLASDLRLPLEHIAEAALTDQELPGISIAMRLPDGRVLTGTAGFADVERATPMTATTRLPGGSTGKTFAAGVAMQLVEEGVLDPEALISIWFGNEPWFDRLPNGSEIRLHHLLTHTSGLKDHVEQLSFAISATWARLTGDPDDYFTPVELVGFVLDEEPLFAPGEGYAYTDTGYILVGMIIEAATGSAYYDLLDQRVLAPLELTDTQPAVTRTPGNLAAGYVSPRLLTVLAGLVGKTVNDEGELTLHPGSEWTGGGLFNTPSMLVRFYSALAEGEVVSQAAYATMRDAGFGPADNHYGYGLYIRHHPDLGPTSGHGGWYPGYSTAVAYFPDHRIAVAVQTNTDGDRVDLYEPLIEAAQLWLTLHNGAPIQPE